MKIVFSFYTSNHNISYNDSSKVSDSNYNNDNNKSKDNYNKGSGILELENRVTHFDIIKPS